ncbi:MAG: complex I NDUFA9 subunit family protein [Asticcacaulis sp.]
MAQLVTVFGGSGFLGKQVLRVLARQGWRIRVAVNKATEAYDLKLMGDVGQIQVVRCDVRKEDEIVRALDGASACVNLVGILYQTMGVTFDAMHRQAAEWMADSCKARGIRDFVQVSALGADPQSPSVYAATKAEAEAAVRSRIPTAVIIRPSLMFGPQDGFFTSLAGQVKLFPVMPSIDGGQTKFQPVYVGDVATSIGRVLGNADAYGKVYELGGPEVFSFNELVNYVAAEVMQPRPLVPLPVFAANLIGMVGNVQGWAKAILPIIPAPLLTTDQVKLLGVDNVVSPGALGLKDLGIAPVAVESIVPTYLWRFRKNGQFAVATQS